MKTLLLAIALLAPSVSPAQQIIVLGAGGHFMRQVACHTERSVCPLSIQAVGVRLRQWQQLELWNSVFAD